MADEEGGGIQRLAGLVSSFPWARQIAQQMTADQAEALAERVGRQMEQAGVGVDLAPVLDLDAGSGPNSTDPDGLRSFSAEPGVASSYGVAFMKGLRAGGVLPVVKHFPGLGGGGNTDYGPGSTPPLSTLRSSDLLPFRAAIEAGAPAVMVSNASIPGLTNLPSSLSAAAITGLLRQSLGFQGLVLTDSLSAGAITQAGYDLPSAVVAALRAGSDMILFGSTLNDQQTALLSPSNLAHSITSVVAAIERATATGALTVARLDDAVGHVLNAEHVDLCSG
jgi:beta-N-acetylhexosaminidase